MDTPIYLDHNSSTPVLPRVRDVMARALEEGFGNPSADHVHGRRARAFITRAREQVAALLGCDPDEVLFTGSGTESSNLAIRGVLLEDARLRPHHVRGRAPGHARAREDRRVDVTIEAKVFGVGKVLEALAEKELRAGWDKSALFLNAWLSEHPAGTRAMMLEKMSRKASSGAGEASPR